MSHMSIIVEDESENFFVLLFSIFHPFWVKSLLNCVALDYMQGPLIHTQMDTQNSGNSDTKYVSEISFISLCVCVLKPATQ